MASRRSQKYDDLTSLDWDDSALLKAYDKGLELREELLKNGNGEKSNQKKKSLKKWKVGDYCRAVYYGDDLLYEAKIINISDDYCTVMFLGYDEEVEVELNSLTETKGKSARKKQIKKATVALKAQLSASVDDLTSDSQPTPKSKKKFASYAGNQVVDHSLCDHTAAESTFHAPHDMPHCSGPSMPPCSGPSMPANFVPPAPPMLQHLDIAQNPSFYAMLTSWYMAGYYTGLHKAQKGVHCQQRCCHVSQNCCLH